MVGSTRLWQASASGANGATPFVALEGQVPGTRTARVEIADGATVLAASARTPHRPRVQVLSPRRGARVRGGLTVRWRASDADGGPLDVTIGYSADGGRRYRVVAGGTGRTAVTLPAELLRPSRNARLRLRVSDGFNTTRVTSAPFVVARRAPRVVILDAGPGLRSDAGAEVVLNGQARDDQGRPIVGRRLRWLAGRRLLGTGTALSAEPRLGTRSIRLVATDRAGRVGSASVPIRVRATTPFFVRFDAAGRIARRATSVLLTAATTQAATLRVGRRRFAVGPAARRLRLPVPRGRGRHTLRLTLTAGGRRAVRLLVVTRR